MEREQCSLFLFFSNMGINDKIISLLDAKFLEEGFTDCFIIDIVIPSSNRIEVYLDSDSGISFGTCARISRYLEAALEEGNYVPEEYKIEVSSPCVTRPLKFRRQYVKHIGRKLKVITLDGQEIKGNLTEVNENGITLFFKQRIKEGKKKVTKEITENISFDQINKSIVQISF